MAEIRHLYEPAPFGHIVEFYLVQSRKAKGFALEQASERVRAYAHATWWGGYWIPSFES